MRQIFLNMLAYLKIDPQSFTNKHLWQNKTPTSKLDFQFKMVTYRITEEDKKYYDAMKPIYIPDKYFL